MTNSAKSILQIFVVAILIIPAFLTSSVMAAEETEADYKVTTPPKCENNKGEKVSYIAVDRARKGQSPRLAAGMANRDKEGKPVIYRSNFSAAPPEFQKFIDRHECAHHQTGDVDRPHPPRNGPEHLMNESISDCIAILRLRDEEGYDKKGFDKVAAAMRNDMQKMGFPEISMKSRVSNIKNCFEKYGPADEFIAGILERRGLLDR